MKKVFFQLLIIFFIILNNTLIAQEIKDPKVLFESEKISSEFIEDILEKESKELGEEELGEEELGEEELEEEKFEEEDEFSLYGVYTDYKKVFSMLPRFGNDIFNTSSLSFATSGSTPIPSNYILGSGDELSINIWGTVEQTYSIKVNYEGEIFISNVGSVFVQGKTLSQVKDLLIKLLNIKFPNSKIHLTLNTPKLLNIFVYGEVNRPCGYTLSPLSTLFQALFSANGINDRGSMRYVQVIRNNKVLKIFDLYPFILTGIKDDIVLQPNDVIFVPVAQNMVAIKGSVKRNEVFELKKDEGLKELISFAGGFTADADLHHIQINRILTPEQREFAKPERIIINIDYTNFINENTNFLLQDGDIVTVFKVSNLINNYVVIKGSVFKPGTYSINPGLSLFDLLIIAGGVFDNAFLQRCDVLRTYPDGTNEIFDLNLEAIIKGELNFELQKLDEVNIYSIWDFKDKFSVSIRGAVRKPGSFLFTDSMNLSDVLTQAGGFTYNADTTYVEISRMKEIIKSDTLWDVFRVNLLDKSNKNFPLQQFDDIFVRHNISFKLQEIVTIHGEVKYPGNYSLITQDDDLLSLIKRAGGITNRAFLKGTMILRSSLHRAFTNSEIKSIINNAYEMELDTINTIINVIEKSGFIKFEDINFRRLNIDLDLVLKGKQKFILKKGDIINIPPKSDEIFVLGAIPRSGTYKLKDGVNYKYYIQSAGGLNRNADKKNISVLKYNGLVYSKNLSRVPIENGDYIIIPKKVKRVSTFWRDTTHVVTILGSIASTIYILTNIK